MSHNTVPVFAAIPHYEATEELADMLPVLMEQDYDKIIVNDDASPSDKAQDELRTLARQYPIDLTHYKNHHGPGDTRNRFLYRFVQAPDESILHFIDTGMKVLPNEAPAAKIRERMSEEDVGMGGGLVLTPDGRQDKYNFGPVFSLRAGIGSQLQNKFDALVAAGDLEKAQAFRDKHPKWFMGWPDTSKTPEPTTTAYSYSFESAWVHEGNLFIKRSDLQRGGGFAATAIHEVQPLGVELHKQGLRVAFEPSIAVQRRQPEQQTLRSLAENLGITATLVQRHGIRRYLRS